MNSITKKSNSESLINGERTNAAEMATKIDFFNLLSDEEKKLVQDNVFIREYVKGEMIHSCTGACLGMIFVIKGSIRTSVISQEGRELTLFRIREGDTCVISAACVLHEIRLESSMTATENTSLLVLSAKALSQLVEKNLSVKSYCYEIAVKRFSTALFVLQEIILLRFDQRLARYLVNSSEKAGSLKLKITQESIASEVNSAREVVARMLKQFETEGLVELKRGCIEIKDENGLRALF